jgi:hypothetical protein
MPDAAIAASKIAKIPIAGAVPGAFVQPDDCSTAPAFEVCIRFPRREGAVLQSPISLHSAQLAQARGR